MLAPTFLFVAVITMIGYFQLFAEPYVMTQGGPAHSTLSIVLLMYQQGFRWWNMGYAAAIAFVLFAIILALTLLAAACGARRERGGADEAAPAAPRSRDDARLRRMLALAAATLLPLLWMVSASFMPTGEASTGRRSSAEPPTLEHYRTLFARLNLARALLNSTLLATAVTADLAALQLDGRLRLREASASRAATASFGTLLAALVIPAQVAMLPLFLMLKELGLVNTYWGVIIPGMASIFGIFLVRQYALVDPRRACSTRRASTAPASSASTGRSCCRFCTADPGDARDLHVHGHVERLPVAAHRADRRATSTRCRWRWPTSSASTCRTPS